MLKNCFLFKQTNPNSAYTTRFPNTNCALLFGFWLVFSLLVHILINFTVHYNASFINISHVISYEMHNICIILPLFMSINIFLSDLLTYMHKHYLYNYINKQLNKFLLILNGILCYLYKVISNSIKFRIKICVIMSIFNLIGLNQNTVYYMVMFYIVVIMSISMYKSNSKFKQLYKFVVNLAIIFIFWYTIKDINYLNIIIILLYNNIIFTFDEWDFDFEMDLSEIINSLELHNYSIGDPSVIPPKPPIPPKLKHLVHDADTEGPFESSGKKYRDPSLFSTWNMHMPSESNYRNYIIVNGFVYPTNDIQDALEFKAGIIENDMAEHKKYINDYKSKNSHKWTTRIEGQSIEDHRLELEWRMFQFSYEYNTLVKANTYYVQGGIDTQGNLLHHSFRDSAEGWQKRQISTWSEVYVDIYNIQAQNPFQPSNILYAKNYFDDMVAYKEVRENLFWIKLFLIQADYVLKNLDTDNKKDYTYDEYDDKIENLNLECYNKHKIAYTVHKNYEEWLIKNLANPLVTKAFHKLYEKDSGNSILNQEFKDKVHQTFLEAEAVSKKE